MRGELAGQLRRPHLAAAGGGQQAHAPQQRRDGGGEGQGIDAQRVAGRQKDVVEAAGLGGQRDVAAVLPARLQLRIGHAEELIVVVAKRR